MTDATIRHDHKFALETLPVSLEDEMRKSYLDYAMSVIVGRALPDVRDGLKPVHRRVLYAMHELKNNWNAAYKNRRASSATSSVNTTPTAISQFTPPSSVWRKISLCVMC